MWRTACQETATWRRPPNRTRYDEEVHLNLAYRWFCRLGLDGDVPDHSTFSKNRHGRFRESDLLRQLFETVVRRCMAEGLVGGGEEELVADDDETLIRAGDLRRYVKVSRVAKGEGSVINCEAVTVELIVGGGPLP